MIPRVLLVILLFPGALLAGASASYTLDPLASATGGESGSSPAYSLAGSTTPGGQAASSDYEARGGYAGQLAFARALVISAPASLVQEEESIQLDAGLSFDDGTSIPMAAAALTWSVESGPIAGISAAGLATAEAVHQDSPAAIRVTNGALSGDLALTVLDTDSDNYGTYADDGLPDVWQVRHFGPASTGGGQNADFDEDGVLNLAEFANGTDPANPGSGPGPLRLSGNVLQSPGSPLVEYAPAPNVLDHRVLFVRRKDAAALRLGYVPQFSRNLTAWSNATTPLIVIADDATYEVVSVRFPVLIGGLRSSSKFFRMNLSIAPPPP